MQAHNPDLPGHPARHLSIMRRVKRPKTKMTYSMTFSSRLRAGACAIFGMLCIVANPAAQAADHQWLTDLEFQRDCLHKSNPDTWSGFRRGYGYSPIWLANCSANGQDFQMEVGLTDKTGARDMHTLYVKVGTIKMRQEPVRTGRAAELYALARKNQKGPDPAQFSYQRLMDFRVGEVDGVLKYEKPWQLKAIQDHSAVFSINNTSLNLTQALTVALSRLAGEGSTPKLLYQDFLNVGNDQFYVDLAQLPEGSWSAVVNAKAAKVAQRKAEQQKKSIESYFDDMENSPPPYQALEAVFEKVAAANIQDKCPATVASTLTAARSVLGGVIGSEWSGYGQGGALDEPGILLKLMATPNPALPVVNGNNPRSRGIALHASSDCSSAYLQFKLHGSSTGGRYRELGYAKLVYQDPGSDFGRVIIGPVAYRNFGFTNAASTQAAKSLVCIPGQCFEGTLASLYPTHFGRLKSADAWPAQLKTELAVLEKQKRLVDEKTALAQKAAEAKQAADNKAAALANERAAKARESRFHAALNAKDGQTMYLAAGSYEREGEKYAAQQVYERIVSRFPSSLWAVKANDQLLAIERVNSLNAAAENANREAGDRSYQACKIEMDTCYNQGGKNCYRNCGNLR
jgi:hypothetical protein